MYLKLSPYAKLFSVYQHLNLFLKSHWRQWMCLAEEGGTEQLGAMSQALFVSRVTCSLWETSAKNLHFTVGFSATCNSFPYFCHCRWDITEVWTWNPINYHIQKTLYRMLILKPFLCTAKWEQLSGSCETAGASAEHQDLAVPSSTGVRAKADKDLHLGIPAEWYNYYLIKWLLMFERLPLGFLCRSFHSFSGAVWYWGLSSTWQTQRID